MRPSDTTAAITALALIEALLQRLIARGALTKDEACDICGEAAADLCDRLPTHAQANEADALLERLKQDIERA